MRYPDLHLHLDGSLRLSTLKELAEKHDVSVKDHFGFHKGMTLSACLACFQTTLSVLREPSSVRRVAAEICEDAEATGVSVLEIRFAPQLHDGLDRADEFIEAAIEGAAGRAGIILCGLYGESPDVLSALVELGSQRPQVVGIDLAGGPAPDHDWSLPDYAEPFAEAKRVGLGRTAHVAEGRPADEITVAIEKLQVNRIGHGTSLLNEPDVVSLLVETGVTVEACITSNFHTGIIFEREEHPLPRWLDAGVCATICTDNTLMSDTDIQKEYEIASRIPGMTEGHLRLSAKYGINAAFSGRQS